MVSSQAQPTEDSTVLWLLSRANRGNVIKGWVFRDISKEEKNDRSKQQYLLFKILAIGIRLEEDS